MARGDREVIDKKSAFDVSEPEENNSAVLTWVFNHTLTWELVLI